MQHDYESISKNWKWVKIWHVYNQFIHYDKCQNKQVYNKFCTYTHVLEWIRVQSSSVQYETSQSRTPEKIGTQCQLSKSEMCTVNFALYDTYQNEDHVVKYVSILRHVSTWTRAQPILYFETIAPMDNQILYSLIS